MHVVIWTAALLTDERNRNDACETDLWSLFHQLKSRMLKTDTPVGKAWTHRTKRILAEHGVNLNR